MQGRIVKFGRNFGHACPNGPKFGRRLAIEDCAGSIQLFSFRHLTGMENKPSKR